MITVNHQFQALPEQALDLICQYADLRHTFKLIQACSPHFDKGPHPLEEGRPRFRATVMRNRLSHMQLWDSIFPPQLVKEIRNNDQDSRKGFLWGDLPKTVQLKIVGLNHGRSSRTRHRLNSLLHQSLQNFIYELFKANHELSIPQCPNPHTLCIKTEKLERVIINLSYQFRKEDLPQRCLDDFNRRFWRLENLHSMVCECTTREWSFLVPALLFPFLQIDTSPLTSFSSYTSLYLLECYLLIKPVLCIFFDFVKNNGYDFRWWPIVFNAIVLYLGSDSSEKSCAALLLQTLCSFDALLSCLFFVSIAIIEWQQNKMKRSVRALFPKE